MPVPIANRLLYAAGSWFALRPWPFWPLLPCSSALANPAAATPPPAQVLVEKTKLEDLAFYLDIRGVLPVIEVQVRAQVSGILQQRSHQEGTQVKQGQVLFSIDPRTYQAALARARSLAQE